MAAFAYGGAMQEAIRRWKNAPDEGLGRPLANAMLWELQKVGAKDALLMAAGPGGDPVANPPVVVPIPSRYTSLKVRAFNPAAALALGAAKAFRWPYRPSTLSFVGLVPSSRGLGRRERAERMKGVMRAEPRYVTGRHVLIVDDVITTGATVAEAARACLEAGANTVTVVALARVPGS
jgi:predicted amidophosphoribosyltransferase